MLYEKQSNNKNTRVTMKQIAAAAGTSIGSVDRALRGRAGINAKTKEHILKVASQLGYTRNHVASALSRRKTLRLGIVYAHKPSAFYDSIHNGVMSASEELSDFGLDIQPIRSHHLTPEEQSALLNSISPDDFDGFAINASGSETDTFISRCKQAGIPAITFNSDSPDSERLFFVGNDAATSGRLGGELLGKLLTASRKPSKAWVMGNFPEDATLSRRAMGFKEVLTSDFPNISLGHILSCNGNSDVAEEMAYDIIYKHKDEQIGFFTSSYAATIGVLGAVSRHDTTYVQVVGYDLSDVIAQALRNGKCAATIYQDPFTQAYKATKLLVRHVVEGWEPSHEHYNVGTHIILKHNVGSFLKKRGERDE